MDAIAPERTVRFLENRQVRDQNLKVVASFKAGEAYSLPAESAERWVRRKAAEFVDAAPSPGASGSPAPPKRPRRKSAKA